MYKHLLKIWLIVALVPASIVAQEQVPDVPVEDTTIGVVSPPEIAYDSSSTYNNEDSSSSYTDDYEEEAEDTLYFASKADPFSLYDSSLLQWRAVPDSAIRSQKTDEAFWYADLARNSKKKENKKTNSDTFGDSLSMAIIRQVLWIVIIVVFCVAVIWFLTQNKMTIFGRGKGPRINADEKEGEVENIFSADLQKAINAAVANDQYRLAIRLSYLQLLRKLADNGYIKYSDDATNMDYLSQLYGQSFYKDFFKITRYYEYAWYGEMNVNKQIYELVQNDFTALYKKTALSS